MHRADAARVEITLTYDDTVRLDVLCDGEDVEELSNVVIEERSMEVEHKTLMKDASGDLEKVTENV